MEAKEAKYELSDHGREVEEYFKQKCPDSFKAASTRKYPAKVLLHGESYILNVRIDLSTLSIKLTREKDETYIPLACLKSWTDVAEEFANVGLDQEKLQYAQDCSCLVCCDVKLSPAKDSGDPSFDTCSFPFLFKTPLDKKCFSVCVVHSIRFYDAKKQRQAAYMAAVERMSTFPGFENKLAVTFNWEGTPKPEPCTISSGDANKKWLKLAPTIYWRSPG